jgi:two-component system sensor histidine kinase PilS (NtrC family)
MRKNRQEGDVRPVPWITMMTMLGGRLAAISAFLIFLSFVMGKDSVAFYAFIAFTYIVTIPYSLWMRNQEKMRRLAPLQFLVDLVFVSGLIYFAGDIGNDFLTLLYPLIILSAGIILPLKQTVQITLLAILSYILVVLLMSQNILVQYPSAPASRQMLTSSGALLLRIALFAFFGLASAYVSRRCDYISKKEKQFGEITKIIFQNVKTGLLLLDADDCILMANDRACILLGRDESELAGKSLSSIYLRPADVKPADTDLRGASDYFRRADGSVFPVSIEDARLTLPAEAVPYTRKAAKGLVDTRILNFNDISYFLRLQSQTRQIERIKSAANMAKEMAHQIRTPLTGISGTVQLLQINLRGGDAANPAIANEREELCRQIVMESIRMDKVIQNFLDYAEFSPKDIRSLIQMDIDQEVNRRQI